MKIKTTLMMFLALFSIQAFACVDRELCDFDGVLDPSERGEEFKMLLENSTRPNYKEMVETISGMVFVLGKDPTKIDSTCKSSLYIKQLLEFYENPVNKKEIKDKHSEAANFIEILRSIVVENELVVED